MLETASQGRGKRSLNQFCVMGTQPLHFLFIIPIPGKSLKEKNNRCVLKHPPYYAHFPSKSGCRVTLSPHSLQSSAALQLLLPFGQWPQDFLCLEAPGRALSPEGGFPVPPELHCPAHQSLAHVASGHLQCAGLN